MFPKTHDGCLSKGDVPSEATISIFAAKVILLFCKRQLYMKKNNKKCRFNVKSCKTPLCFRAECLTNV